MSGTLVYGLHAVRAVLTRRRLIAAAGLALLAHRTQAAEIRTGVGRRGSTGKLTHFVSRFKNRFGSIF